MMWFILLISTFFNPNDSIQVKVNGKEAVPVSSILVHQNDQLSLSYNKLTHWVVYEPLLMEYDNLAQGQNKLADIKYKARLVSTKATDVLELDLPPGTYYIGIDELRSGNTYKTYAPLHLTLSHVVQVTIREDDSYLGLLTELIGLPFVLPPRILPQYGHQTDLRVGTDCAELAIYGMRRTGRDIPYVGPSGILDYLEPAPELKPGTIIHYGFQVSVLYEDRGEKGQLDPEDLLIHAYEDRVAIEKLGDLALARLAYKLYQWRDQ